MQLPRCCVGNFYELELALVSYRPLAQVFLPALSGISQDQAPYPGQSESQNIVAVNVCASFRRLAYTCEVVVKDSRTQGLPRSKLANN